MVAAAAHDVVRLQQRFGREALDVVVAGGVEQPVAVAPDDDHVGGAELGEVLGDRCRAGSDVVGEVVDRVLAVEQGPHDPQPGGIGEQLQDADGDVDLTI